MNVNNRRVNKEDLTFFQWLNIYEFMTKREFKELEEYKQENYKREFEMWKKGIVNTTNTNIFGFWLWNTL